MEDNNKKSLDDFFRDAYRPPKEKNEHKPEERRKIVRYIVQGFDALFSFGFGLYYGITDQNSDFLSNVVQAVQPALVLPLVDIFLFKQKASRAFSDGRYIFPAALLGLYVGQYCRNST